MDRGLTMHDLKLYYFSIIYLDQDECEVDSPCDENANCTNTMGSYACECNAMYFGDGVTCESKIARC